MSFSKALKEACICLDLKSNTKQAVVEELVDLMVAEGKIKDREETVSAVMERERKMSTGMQFGVAIPHGKTNTVENLVTALGFKREGMDFASFDGQPSRIFVMTISPINRTGPHIQYLSEISKLLNRPSVRKQLLEAGTKEEVLTILAD